MLSTIFDFSHFDRVDWSTKKYVGIRFMVELLAHIYGRKPEQIIESLCLCNEALPGFHYDEEEHDNSNDSQWKLFRYRTVQHARVLLSNTLESSKWERVPNCSIDCREQINYKSATYPDASVVETIFESRNENSGVSEVIRIVTPNRKVPFADCWAHQREIEKYLANVPAFSGWLTLLPELAVTPSAGQIKKTEKRSLDEERRTELLEATIAGQKSGDLPIKPSVKQLLHYMKNRDYPNCNGASVEAVQKSIERTGGKLSDDISTFAQNLSDNA